MLFYPEFDMVNICVYVFVAESNFAIGIQFVCLPSKRGKKSGEGVGKKME